MPILTRRKLITSLGFLIAAPAIVRVGSLMPVKACVHSNVLVRVSTDEDVVIATVTIPGGFLTAGAVVVTDLRSLTARVTDGDKLTDFPMTVDPRSRHLALQHFADLDEGQNLSFVNR